MEIAWFAINFLVEITTGRNLPTALADAVNGHDVVVSGALGFST
jgi:hypothetical protein